MTFLLFTTPRKSARFLRNDSATRTSALSNSWLLMVRRFLCSTCLPVSMFPLLNLPSGVNTTDWSMFANDGQAKIELPEASKVLTQCYKQCQLLYFNFKFFQFIVASPSYRTALGNRIDLNAIVLLYPGLSGGASIGFGGEVTTFGKDAIRQTLAYYFGEEYYLPVFFGMKTRTLLEARKTVEAKFVEKLIALPPFHHKKDFKVNREQAERGIKTVTQKMETEMDEYFANKVKANVFVVTYSITDIGAMTKKGEEAKELLKNPKVRAFLEMIKYAEAYLRVLGGGLPMQYDEASNFVKLPNYDDHPGKTLPGGSTSAAGAYQAITETWFGKGTDIGAKRLLGLRNFKPESQDIFGAYKLIERGITTPLLADRFADAIYAGRKE